MSDPAPDPQAEALKRGRLEHYRSVRWWYRRLVRSRGLAPAVAAARVTEQSEASAQNRSESESVRRWLMATVRIALDDEQDGNPSDIDGRPFDPGELLWRAFLEERGLQDDGAEATPDATA